MISPKWVLFVTVLLFGLLFAACTPNQQPTGLTPIPSLAPRATETLAPALQSAGGILPVAAGPGKGDAALGSAIYMKYCAGCHGNNGQGVTGPELLGDQFLATSDDSALFTKIALGARTGDKIMPGWLITKGGELNSDEINNVIAYLRILQGEPVLPTATPLPPPPTETPLPAGAATPEPEGPARPSNEGGPGPALSLTGNANNGRVLFGVYCSGCHGPQGLVPVPNPGSDDQAVPQLAPIDETIVDKDPKVFASNVDLFVEHGSVPAGTADQINMPAFGDLNLLKPQQIADIIAYIIGNNP
jgi:mono/diheme cytochrome c family protein